MPRRPPRLQHFDYIGRYAYFLTACTHGRLPHFVDTQLARDAVAQILHHAEAQSFAVSAYCVMPDHVHILVEARADDADARAFARRWRQGVGYQWRRAHAGRLWQEGYWDWVLRPDEDPLRVAAYIVQNPVRARLVARVEDYAWVGSSEYTIEQLVTAVRLRPGRRD